MQIELTEQQQMVRDLVRSFAQERLKPIAGEIDRAHRFPAEIVEERGWQRLGGRRGRHKRDRPDALIFNAFRWPAPEELTELEARYPNLAQGIVERPVPQAASSSRCPGFRP